MRITYGYLCGFVGFGDSTQCELEQRLIPHIIFNILLKNKTHMRKKAHIIYDNNNNKINIHANNNTTNNIHNNNSDTYNNNNNTNNNSNISNNSNIINNNDINNNSNVTKKT